MGLERPHSKAKITPGIQQELTEKRRELIAEIPVGTPVRLIQDPNFTGITVPGGIYDDPKSDFFKVEPDIPDYLRRHLSWKVRQVEKIGHQQRVFPFEIQSQPDEF